MCIRVYLSTDLEIEAVPFSQTPVEILKRQEGRFRICRLDESEGFVRAFFSKRNVYYLASHEDCSCGFEWNAEDDKDPWDNEDDGDRDARETELQAMSDEMIEEMRETHRKWVAARQRTAQDLEALLMRQLQQTDDVEIGVFDDPECQGAWSSQRVVVPSEICRGQPDVFPVVGVRYKVVAHRPRAVGA